MNKRSTLGGGTLIVLAVLFIGLTVLFGSVLRGWRLDLTEGQLYTIAPGTRNILKSLKEPINLYFFFSDEAATQFPPLKTYAGRVREFLEELAARSDGKVRLTVIDPQPFSEEEDRASELGVRPVPLGNGSANIYFGLAATNSTDGRQAIPFFDPAKEEFLEYDVAKAIYQLTNAKKPVVAWLSTIPTGPSMDPSGGERGPSMVYQQAEELFDIRTLDPQTGKIDPDVNVVVLVHPKNLSPATQFALDQYALRGGRILAFVDPMAEQDPAGQQPAQALPPGTGVDKSSHLEPLLQAWGVDFDRTQVVGDLEHALQVGMRPGAAPVRHLGILGLDQSSFNRSDVITAGLSNINVASAGFVSPHKGADVKFEPLLQSSTEAGLIPTTRFTSLFEPETLLDGFKPTGQRYTIGARVSGKVKTAFPNGPPAGVTPVEGQPVLKESTQPLNLVVIADTDILADQMWVRKQNFFGQTVGQAFAHNGDFVFNALDNLSGSGDLISVRGRSTFTRPFKVVENLRGNAESRFRAKEQELESELDSTEEKLRSLQSSRDESAEIILSKEQEQEIERFQQEKLRIRKELRDVRLGLDQDIRRLGAVLKFVNIVAVPLIFAMLAIAITWWRRRPRPSANTGAGAPT